VSFDFSPQDYLRHISFWEELSEIWSWMYLCVHVQYSFLSYFNETRIFSTDIPNTIKYQILWQSV